MHCLSPLLDDESGAIPHSARVLPFYCHGQNWENISLFWDALNHPTGIHCIHLSSLHWPVYFNRLAMVKTELSLFRQTNEDTSSARGDDVLVRRATSFYVHPIALHGQTVVELCSALQYLLWNDHRIIFIAVVTGKCNARILHVDRTAIDHLDDVVTWWSEPIPRRVRVLVFTREPPDHFCVTWISW